VARWRQGVVGDLEGATGKVPGNEERAGKHWNGRSTVRRHKRRRAAESSRRGGVQRRWGCSGGRRCAGRCPVAPVWKGKERFSSNSRNGKARRALTGEGEDSGGARQNPT
jgi:hypothetical protein